MVEKAGLHASRPVRGTGRPGRRARPASDRAAGPPAQSLGAGRAPHLRQRRAGPGLRAARRGDRRSDATLAGARPARLDLQAVTGRRRAPGVAGDSLDRPDDVHHRVPGRGGPGDDGCRGRRAYRRGGPGAGQPAARQRRLWIAGLRLPAGQALPNGPEPLGIRRLAAVRRGGPAPAGVAFHVAGPGRRAGAPNRLQRTALPQLHPVDRAHATRLPWRARRRSPAPRPWPRCAWCTPPTSRPPADKRFGSRRSPSGAG